MRVTPDILIGPVSMAVDRTSGPQQLNQQFGYCIQANYPTGGTLAGTLRLECSLDYAEDLNGNTTHQGTWTTIKDSPKVISAADDPQAYTWNVSSVYYPWVRLVYDSSPGDTGILTAYFFGRGF